MKKHQGWWLPDDEKHLVEVIKDSEYQGWQRRGILQHVPKGGVAFDIGANVGTWTIDMIDHFDKVYCFEPIEHIVSCLERNLVEKIGNYYRQNCEISQIALSNENGKRTARYVDNSCGDSTLSGMVEGSRPVTVQCERLDDWMATNKISYDYLSFMKLDVQFHELEVLQGGEKTIRKYRPMLCVELAKRNDEEKERSYHVKEYLNSLDYEFVISYKKEHLFWSKDHD